jgi:hypothetical protein
MNRMKLTCLDRKNILTNEGMNAPYTILERNLSRPCSKHVVLHLSGPCSKHVVLQALLDISLSVTKAIQVFHITAKKPYTENNNLPPCC